MLIFDIETGPLSDEQLATLAPEFIPPPHPGQFDPASVKIGNLKDQAKIDAKIIEAKELHAAEVASWEKNVPLLKAAKFASFQDKAALDATTGRIVAIGYQSGDGKVVIDDGGGDEAKLIAGYWQKQQKVRGQQRKLVGANILGFDLPFLVRRSWILGVDVPGNVRNGRYFDSCFIDLRDVWLCGQKWGECPSSLDVMARALGCGSKNGHGGDFAKLWFGSAEEKQQAVAYLLNDLAMTAAVAVKLGVV